MALKARLTYSGLAAVLALGTGFSQNGVANAREVRVYSGRHYNTDRQIYKKFSEQTGIKVRLIESSGISLLERLKREGANSQADVIILVDAARISNAAKEGLLQPSRSAKLDSEVPRAYRDPQGRWYGLTRRVRVIVANASKVNVGSIRTYADLASPSLKGKVCLRKRNNVYNQSLVADQLVLRGEAATKSWLQGMISNVSQPYFGGDVSLARAVSQGICGVGIVNHYYVARMRAGVSGSKDKALANKLTVITPDPAHVNVSAGGLARYAKNKKEAIQLLEFLASPDGSQGMASPTYEHPLNGYGTSLELKKFGTFRPDRVTISQLGANNAKAIQLMAQSGWK
ncbi:Iron deficiency-induced protein A precursor [Prochlorococcus marinus str. MIT 1313]|uniref:Fe(3+) ABC transporter substrate-binding protein n=1 Tax=Prochlorococcus TaxID=1218 RepID=UPI0007B33C06|nr:Fe(3+) ABC transporter substrate-binding protein [Prochlorococcus marinus]KZR70070.1 Iron deficiency-induced protein A precursor [Prochlorococcus marinus str. MIT 1313]KZR72794.1 Iron deficiency-induced protein A precursor [Prochlorococcus marinus str. MIT 1318]